MASLEAIAIMREREIARVTTVLESQGVSVDFNGLDKDPRLAEAQLLGRIADALEENSIQPSASSIQEPVVEPAKGKARK